MAKLIVPLFVGWSTFENVVSNKVIWPASNNKGLPCLPNRRQRPFLLLLVQLLGWGYVWGGSFKFPPTISSNMFNITVLYKCCVISVHLLPRILNDCYMPHIRAHFAVKLLFGLETFFCRTYVGSCVRNKVALAVQRDSQVCSSFERRNPIIIIITANATIFTIMSPMMQLSPPSYIYHYNETFWFHCIACRNRKISRIIPFCWLAGLYNIFDSNSLSLFKLKDWWSLSNRNNNLMMSRAGLSSLILEYVFFLKEEKT